MDDFAAASGGLAQQKRWLRLPERLPDLKGRWLTLYTVVWAIMVPLAVIGAARGTYIVMTVPAMWTPYGFATTEDSNGIHVDAVAWPADRAAGLAAGDYVVAIDGWRVPPLAARAAARPHVLKADGKATTFTVRKPDGSQSDIRLIFSRAIDEQSYRNAGISRTFARAANFAGVLLLPGLFVAAAILLFIRRRREAVPALLSLAFLMFAAIINAGDQLGVGIDVINITAGIGSCLLFAALFAFPSGYFVPQWTAAAFLALPLTFLVPPNWVVTGSIIGVVLALLTLVGLVTRYRKVGVGPERLQLRWAFLGLAVGMVLFLITTVAQALTLAFQASDPRWVNWNYAFINPLTGAPLGAIALGLIVSILRYRLYDADAVMGRSAAYGILTLGFVGLFTGTEKLAELVGEKYFEHSIGIAAGAVGAAVAAVCIVPLHNRVHRWAERRFQKPLIRLREGLPECVADLRESASVKTLVSAVMSRVEAGVRSRCEAVLLTEKGKLATAGTRGVSAKAVREWQAGWTAPNGEQPLDCDKSDTVFPLRVRLCIETGNEPEIIGWLLLGPRPDGSFFGKDEREALAEIAGPVARAIHITQLREQRESQAEKRIGALENLIAKLAEGLRPGGATAPA